jgi:hypothetical protein
MAHFYLKIANSIEKLIHGLKWNKRCNNDIIQFKIKKDDQK